MTATAQLLESYLGLAIDTSESAPDTETTLRLLSATLGVAVRDARKVATGQGLYALYSLSTYPWGGAAYDDELAGEANHEIEEAIQSVGAFVAALREYGATDAEIEQLDDTDLIDCIDEVCLAHERLASLRGVESINSRVP